MWALIAKNFVFLYIIILFIYNLLEKLCHNNMFFLILFSFFKSNSNQAIKLFRKVYFFQSKYDVICEQSRFDYSKKKYLYKIILLIFHENRYVVCRKSGNKLTTGKKLNNPRTVTVNLISLYHGYFYFYYSSWQKFPFLISFLNQEFTKVKSIWYLFQKKKKKILRSF